MISRLTDVAQLHGACRRWPFPGSEIELLFASYARAPQLCAFYSCSQGGVLALLGGQAFLAGRAEPREVAELLRFAGIQKLFSAPMRFSFLTAEPMLFLQRGPLTTAEKPISLTPPALPVMAEENYGSFARLLCGEKEEDWEAFYADLCIRRNRGLGQVYTVYEDGVPVGGVAAAGNAVFGVRVSDLYVRPSGRGRGYGGALLAAAAAWQPEAVHWLCCAPSLAGWYARRGFADAKRVPLYVLSEKEEKETRD